jgi:hypothetical protein
VKGEDTDCCNTGLIFDDDSDKQVSGRRHLLLQ